MCAAHNLVRGEERITQVLSINNRGGDDDDDDDDDEDDDNNRF